MAKTLHDLLLEELRDIYSAETQLVRALPKMAKGAASPELRQAFETHLEQTRHQVARLDQVFESLDANAKTRGRKCEAMEGLVSEAQEMLQLGLSPEAQDSALIAAAQKVEHYEIASYGTVIAWAKAMKHNEAVIQLTETLDEERKTDELLNKLSGSINKQAAAKAHPVAA
jgi:ferritin-like metal-binding protein YciE